jgi:8-oxo-dGTP pyrophosphatase MutT (NUDIX family)
MLEKSIKFDRVIIHHHDYKLLKEDFLGLFDMVRASGGIVFNKAGKLLVIFRKGFWDLPKGKIEVGEKKKQAGIREVMEETGLKNVKLKKKIGVTYHTFKTITKARNLKKTWWYLMETSDNVLVPQQEESIEKAEWVDIDEFMNSDQKTYKNIIDILKKYIDIKGHKAPSKLES